MSELDIALLPEAQTAKAWPFEEARRLIARLDKIPGGKDKAALFETGYGPSGLPHIGTFGEVARTTHGAPRLRGADRARRRGSSASPTTWTACVRCPTNVPNQEMLAKHLDKPLTSVPDPFGKYRELRAAQQCACCAPSSTVSASNTNSCRATECYKAGLFDATLLQDARGLRQGDGDHPADARAGAAARPIRRSCPYRPRTGKVLQVPMIARDVEAGTITYVDPETGEKVETPVTGGRVKCQWKADWAMRWTALGVDYEMAGKDLIDSVTLSSQDLPGARRHAARGLQLRAVPRREGPEDLEVQGQRHHHRGVADLCVAGKPVALHVPEAEDGEAALLRRHPARGRRISAVPRRISAPGRQAAARAIRSGTSTWARRRRPICR